MCRSRYKIYEPTHPHFKRSITMDTYTLTKRRNLLIISILLFLISFSGIELGHNISISSIKFFIKETTVIYIILWGMYVYFFIRFFHCLIDEENKDANDVRDLLSHFKLPLYELKLYDNFGGYINKIWHIIVFIFRYIEQLILFVGKSLLENLFLNIYFLFYLHYLLELLHTTLLL